MNAGQLVWVSNPEFKDSYQDDLWLESVVDSKIEVPKLQGYALKVRLLGKEVMINLKMGLTESDKIKPRSPFLNVSEEDVLNIPELNEPEILSFLYKRFEKGLVMTYTGTILLAMNPFEEVKPHNSSSRLIQDFSSSILRETLDPKCTKVHAILISGESGSGKTEISKLVLKAFGTRKQRDEVASKEVNRDVLENLLLANKVLESFGNARTATTANSSRFGKLVQVYFTEDGDLAGCTINTYLLESSRIFTQQAGERNYNIFYQLLAGPSEENKRAWNWKPCNDFFLTNQGGNQRGGTVLLDSKQFQELMKSFEQLEFERDELDALFRMLMGVLYLGEVTFDDYLENSTDRSKIAHANMSVAANLLGLPKDELDSLLTTKVLVAPNKETFKLTLNPSQSGICRDALVKLIFKASFDWVVHSLNKRLHPENANDLKRKVMVLDMFGFDSFQRNSIDQLCINYVNEALQQQFNEHIFRMEVKLYEEEGIKYEKIKFSDNKENVDLIVGIFRILDDQCRLPNPTDKRFVAQIYKEFETNKLFAANKTQQRETKFSITHFAGVVEYTADDFIVKNIDNVPQLANKTFAVSTNQVMNAIFTTINDAMAAAAATPANNRKSVAPQPTKNFLFNKKGAAPPVVEEEAPTNKTTNYRAERTSLVAQIKSELNALMKQIETSAPHYIRCIKPFDKHALGNDTSVSTTSAVMRRKSVSQMHSKVRFNQFKVAQQLHYGGVFEAVRIARSGFRSRMTFFEFYTRYRFITKSVDPNYNDPLIVHPDEPLDRMIQYSKNLISVLAIKDASSDKLSAARVKKISATATLGTDDKQVAEQMVKGLIDANQLQLGETRVFLRKKEYDILEMFRNRSLSTCVVLIQAVVRGFCKHHRFHLMRRNVMHLQRLGRGHLARKWVKMQRILLVSVVTLQRRFRKKRFFRGIVKLQAIVRRLRAVKVVKILQERRAKLLSAYGVLMSGRELRMHRRRLQASKKSSMPVISYLKRRHLHIPPPEIRLEERNYEDDNLTEIIDKVMNGSDSTQSDDNSSSLTFADIIEILTEASEVIEKSDELSGKMTRLINKLSPPERLLKTDVIPPSNSFYTKIFGSSGSKGTITISSAAAAEVHIEQKHPIFVDINYRIQKIISAEQLIIKRIDALNARYPGQLHGDDVEELHNQFSTEENVPVAPASAQKCYGALIKLKVHCGYLYKHYEAFILNFVREFGDSSSFCKSYPARTVYVKALLTQIIEYRKLNDEQCSPIKMEKIRKAAVCPLVLEWDVEREKKEKEQMMTRRLQMIEEANIQDSEILSKLAVADKRREELSTENLRIIELKGIGYQFQPYAPGITYSLNAFNELVGGSFLAGRKLMKVIDSRTAGGKSAIYEACVGATNTSFMDVLYNPVNVEQIDSVSFTSTLITCCVMGIFNLQPNHLLVTYNADNANQLGGTRAQPAGAGYAQLNCIKIAGFNNDLKLTEAFLDHSNPSRRKIHADNMNMLFFLPQMDEPVDPDVRNFLASHKFKSEEIVSHWLRDLFDQNQRVEQLIAADFNGTDLKELHLPIRMIKGCVKEITRRLRHLCLQLEEADEDEKGPNGGNKRITHSQILHEVAPFLSDYYDHERLNAGFAEGIDGVSGVISYAHVYHECLAAEMKLRKAHQRKMEQLKYITKSQEQAQEQTRKFEVDENLNIVKNDDEEIQGFNMLIYKNVQVPTKKKLAYEDGAEPEVEVTHVYGNKDDIATMAAVEKETPVVGANNPMTVGKAAKPQKTRGKAAIVSEETVEEAVTLEDADLGRRYSVFSGDSPMKNRNVKDDGAKINTGKTEQKGIYTKKFAEKQPFKTRPRGTRSIDSDVGSSIENSSVNGSATEDGDHAHSTTDGPSPVSFQTNLENAKAKSQLPIPKKQSAPSVSVADEQKSSSGMPIADLHEKNMAAEKAAAAAAPANKPDIIEDNTPKSRFNTTVEEEALEFLKNIDFKKVQEKIKNGSDMKKFCSTIGKNLSFLPTLWLININENQLKFFFKYWLNIIINKKFEPAKVKLLTKEVYLQYSEHVDDRDLINTKNSVLLYQIKTHLKISIKIVTPPRDSSANTRRLKSPTLLRRFTTQLGVTSNTPTNTNPMLVDGANGSATMESKEYDVSDFEGANKKVYLTAGDQTLDSDDEITPSDYQMKEKLQKILFSCSNLMTAKDFKEAKQKVEVVKRVIHHVCSTEHDYIDGRTVRAFSAILLDYPGLAKIGEVVAERKAFTKDKQVIHKILSHPLVERYTDLLIVLLKNHPDMLWLSDFDSGLLPCDRIKRMPDSKPYKYKLLCKFVNFAGSQPALASGGSIFSSFKGEEELIIRAAQHGLMATEAELRSKRFDMLKKCQAPFVPSHNGRQGQGQMATPGTAGQVKDEALLWRLFVEEINGDERMRNRAWETYELVAQCMKQRMNSDGENPTEIEILMWKSLDLENKSADKCVIYHVSQRTSERSRIFQDLKMHWMPGTKDKTTGAWKPNLIINTEVSRKRFGTLRPMTAPVIKAQANPTRNPTNNNNNVPNSPNPMNINPGLMKSNSTTFTMNPAFISKSGGMDKNGDRRVRYTGDQE